MCLNLGDYVGNMAGLHGITHRSAAKARVVIAPDEYDSPDRSLLPDQSSSRVPSDLHGSSVHYHNDSRLYIGMMMVLYQSSKQGNAVLQEELTVSRDGLHFERPFRSSGGHPFFLPR